MGADDSGAVGGDGEAIVDGDLHAHVHRGFLQGDFRYFADRNASERNGVSCAQPLDFEEVGEEGDRSVGGIGSIGAVGVGEQQREQEQRYGSVEAVSDALSFCEGCRGGWLRRCWVFQELG